MDARGSSDRQLVVDAVGEREIVMTRIVAAPRHLVFDAWTKPEHVARWLLGPGGSTMPTCRIDLRVGGAWRYILHGPNGMKMGMKGVYREISPPDRLVFTESLDDGADDSEKGATPMYPGESINTITLVERAGMTTMTLHSLYPSREIRDAALHSGMETGVAISFDRLEAILGGAGSLP
jgi:uncharacterized protein YndB with AHSA1/START domain